MAGAFSAVPRGAETGVLRGFQGLSQGLEAADGGTPGKTGSTKGSKIAAGDSGMVHRGLRQRGGKRADAVCPFAHRLQGAVL